MGLHFKQLVAWLALTFPVSPQTANAQEAEEAAVLEPSSPWHLDASDEKCRLARRFGEGVNEHLIFMEMDKPAVAVDFSVAGPAIDGTDWSKAIGFQFGMLEPVYEERYSKGTLGKYKPAILTIATSLAPPTVEEDEEADTNGIDNVGGLASIPVERFADNEDLRVIQDNRTIATLRLDELVPALAALNQCAESFVEFWGLDLAQHRTMQRGPKWTNSKAVIRRFMADYPVAALDTVQEGTVRFVVLVDETGKPIECRQSYATELKHLASAACKGMMKARFDPALDADGRPMRSYYATKIRYAKPLRRAK